MKLPSIFRPASSVLAATLLGFSLPPSGTAETYATDPVGFVRSDAKAASDTSLSLPLIRQPEFAGGVMNMNGNVLTSGTSNNWVTNEWIYGVGTNPSNTYYVLITSGSAEGSNYTIASNDANSLTLVQNGGNTVQADGVANNDKYKIVPYWTLNTLLVSGTGVQASPDVFNPKSTVLVTNGNAAGVNLPLATSYLYHSGEQGPAGWYIEGNVGAGLQNDVPLAPDQYFIVRNPAGSGTTNPLVVGSVQMSKFRTVLSVLDAAKQQDNFVGISFPTDVTLAQTGLQNSPAFQKSPDVFNPKDLVIFYNNTTVGINKPLGVSYLYHGGEQGPAGWYIEGNIGAGIQDTQAVIKGGQGFVIRKAAGTAGSSDWVMNPPF